MKTFHAVAALVFLGTLLASVAQELAQVDEAETILFNEKWQRYMDEYNLTSDAALALALYEEITFPHEVHEGGRSEKPERLLVVTLPPMTATQNESSNATAEHSRTESVELQTESRESTESWKTSSPTESVEASPAESQSSSKRPEVFTSQKQQSSPLQKSRKQHVTPSPQPDLHRRQKSFVYEYEGVTGKKMMGVEQIVFIEKVRGRSAVLTLMTEIQDPKLPNPMVDVVFTKFDINEECFDFDGNNTSQWFQLNLYSVRDLHTLYEIGFKAGHCQKACQYLRDMQYFWINDVNATVDAYDLYTTLPETVDMEDVIVFNRDSLFIASIECKSDKPDDKYTSVQSWVLDLLIAGIIVFMCVLCLLLINHCISERKKTETHF